MELSYTTKDGRMTVKLEGDTQAELWRQLAAFQEVFENTLTKYGKESTDLTFVVRKNSDDDEYFELRYSGSDKELFGVKKHFGQTKKGGFLFPKVKDKDNNYLPDSGWVKWNSQTEKEE